MGTPEYAEKLKDIEVSMALLNEFLLRGGTTFAAGNHITLADFALYVTVTTIGITGFPYTHHTRIVEWLESCKAANIPGKDVNDSELEMLREKLASRLAAANSSATQAAEEKVEQTEE